jgi:hypothetical protein
MYIKVTLTGTHSLVMHNVQLANPVNDFTRAIKKITDKKKGMTDEDREQKLKYEFLGSLYDDPQTGIHIPGENIAACLVAAAKMTRMGTLLKQALFVDSNVNPLEYDGPDTPEGLWADKNFRYDTMVRVGASRILRCRPRFNEWRVGATGSLDERVLSVDDFRSIVETAGKRIGLGDYRPRYGRFKGEVEEVG